MITKKIAYIWICDTRAYVLKTKKNIVGRADYYQSCTYVYEKKEWSYPIELIIDRIISVYGLKGYDVSVLLGGEFLLWKRLSLPSKKKKEAYQMVEWDEMIHDGTREYAFDIQLTGKEEVNRTYEWMLGAYPYDLVTQLMDAFEKHECRVETIDVVPALMSRICDLHGEGMVYVCTEGAIHAMFFQDNVPLSYTVTTALPREVLDWLAANEVEATDQLLWLDEKTKVCTSLPLREGVKQKIDTWQLAYPAAILAGF